MIKQNAIEKTLNIMQAFTKAPYAYSAKELSVELEISKPTVHRILNTLKEQNYVKQDAYSGKYSVGYGAYVVGMQYAWNLDVYSEIRKAIDSISAETQTQVGYAVLEGLDVVSVYESISNFINIRYVPGEVFTINCGAYGKVLMAFSHTYEELKKLVYEVDLKPVFNKAFTDPDELLEEYRGIQERGYATSYGEAIEGTIGMGVPVFSSNGKLHGCIAISGIDTPTLRAKMDDCIELLLKSARDVARFLI